jgi:hypothetical protein
MSLKNVPGGLDGGVLDKDIAGSLPAGGILPSAQQHAEDVSATATDLAGSGIPGGFPGDEAAIDSKDQGSPPSQSLLALLTDLVKSMIPTALDTFESGLQWFICWLFPPPRQAAVFEAALSRPMVTSFLICQLICCGLPLLVFLAGTFLFAAVAVLLWAILAFLILGPIILVASMAGVSLWGWGLVVYALVKWADKLFLGGMIHRFWFSQARQERDDLQHSQEGKPDKDRKSE